MALTEVEQIYAKAPAFNGSTHWATYLHQFEAATHLNKWTEGDKGLSLVLVVAELLQKVPSDSLNSHTKLTKSLKLWYGD